MVSSSALFCRQAWVFEGGIGLYYWMKLGQTDALEGWHIGGYQGMSPGGQYS